MGATPAAAVLTATLQANAADYSAAMQATRASQARLSAAVQAVQAELAGLQLPDADGMQQLLALSAKLSKLQHRVHKLVERTAQLDKRLERVHNRAGGSSSSAAAATARQQR